MISTHLKEKFDVHDLEEAKFFLGMELTREREARTPKLTPKKLTGGLVGQYGQGSGTGDKLTKGVSPSTQSGFPRQAVKEALWFRKLGGDLELDFGMVQIYCDNQGALWLLKHAIVLQRLKHIDVIHYFALERVASKEVAFAYCKTEDMTMTKASAPRNS
ncbi:hypothetical protein KFL_013160020 [Klebsormidium nitens]|uniref:Reverse transcriptase Ty1/copia-type domain-containing protein n=1 Tax=Klebsormidium nitens TaxID=105231 RepID=A0A1Y1IU72_KLENI|nr:hypothetical protein KFL_013160020 [Klebsormidium nitens]|eukprot:GAQ93129.1 hypothetical protein KFL_013160020 [Klebsormidium nitens]